jgi:hypothetical protein
MAMNGKNRIMIYGPKTDGTYIVEFKTAAGGAFAISIPRTEASARDLKNSGRQTFVQKLFVESGCRIQKLRHDKRIQPTILLALAKRPRESAVPAV